VPDDDAASAIKKFVTSGLDLLDLDTGEAELAVIEAVDALYRPPLEALLGAELDGVDPEPGTDLSRGPQTLEQR
jgi:hypothetical protein